MSRHPRIRDLRESRVPGHRLFLVREEAPTYGVPARSPAENHSDKDDPDEDDVLDELADQITTLAAQIHAATARLLELIAEFDGRRGWEREGHRSCAHWLAFRTGIDLGAAREKVRAARALTDLPRTRASMGRGELSFSKVRALTRVATAETEADLIELARGCTTAQTERVVRAWKKHSRAAEADLERELHESRTLSVFPDDEGMYRVRGRVPAEVGALLMRAIEAASDALYSGEDAPGETSHRQAARRRADALALIAERAMAAGFGADESPVSGTRAERYQVMLHVSAETLSAEGEGDRSHLEDGTRVSAETSRRLACDAAVVRVTHGSDRGGGADLGARLGPDAQLHVGRRTRTIPPALRRALDVRDRGCRFPGCGLRFTDAHHVKHWADGGGTSLDNCLLLCKHHHRLMHEGRWRVRWADPGHPEFIDPRGGSHYDGRWRAPELAPGLLAGAEGAEALIAANRERGTDPGPTAASARWKRERDIPDEVYFRALEASA